MGDLNVRIGSQRLRNIIGTIGEPTLNSYGKKLTDFCCFKEFRIMNKYFMHKDAPQIYVAAPKQKVCNRL
jgi:hypothetical protein